LAAELDDPTSLASVSASAMTSAASFGDRARFDRYLGLCTSAATRVGQPELVARALGARAVDALLTGDLAATERFANELLPIVSEMGLALVTYGTIIMTVRAHQGRGGEVRDMVASVASNPSGGSAAELAGPGLILADLQSGDVELARAEFAEQARAGFEARDDSLLLTHLCLNAHACARLAQTAFAGELLDRLRPHGRLIAATASVCLFSVPACAGMLAALLGRDDEADRWFSEAIDLTSGFGAPYLVSTARLEWARALSRRVPVDADATRTLLSQALVTARRHGYGEIEREALLLETALDEI
jgi:hypothetical protein